MSVAERVRAVPPELRNAGIAAAALIASMILPWYQKSFVPPGAREFTQANLSAFGVFSFIEAAVLVVAGGVLFLVWARANRRAFHLPGGDGAVVTGAGAWALVLLVWRLFDKPDAPGPSATIGIQWGIFGAMLAAGAIVAAGARVRAAHRPEPPNPAADEFAFGASRRRRDRWPRDAGAVTEVLRDRPSWEGEPPRAPERPRPPRDAGADPADAPTEHLGGSGPRRRRNAGEPPATDRLF